MNDTHRGVSPGGTPPCTRSSACGRLATTRMRSSASARMSHASARLRPSGQGPEVLEDSGNEEFGDLPMGLGVGVPIPLHPQQLMIPAPENGQKIECRN